ncbi:MAG TPA: DUF3108 domain-containing protein [Xanthobacteraceae bacterium]
MRAAAPHLINDVFADEERDCEFAVEFAVDFAVWGPAACMSIATRSRAFPVAALAAALAWLGAASPAAADGKLEAHYRASLAGLPFGGGSWVVDIADDRYAMAASAQVSGLLRVLADGEGAAAVRGTLQGGKVIPASYAVTVRTRSRVDDVKMTMAANNVKDVAIQPPLTPDPERTPLTEAHKKGVIDPISAGIVPAAGVGGLGPEVCQRTVPVFDGRQRFDLALSFKRMEVVKAERGYAGPMVVCAVAYNPIAGHDPRRYAVRYLRDSRETEIGYVPIAGTRFVGMFHIAIPTLLGQAVLTATRFVVTPRTGRAGTSSVKTQ